MIRDKVMAHHLHRAETPSPNTLAEVTLDYMTRQGYVLRQNCCLHAGVYTKGVGPSFRAISANEACHMFGRLCDNFNDGVDATYETILTMINKGATLEEIKEHCTTQLNMG